MAANAAECPVIFCVLAAIIMMTMIIIHTFLCHHNSVNLDVVAAQLMSLPSDI